jgi:hypothetical protein
MGNNCLEIELLRDVLVPMMGDVWIFHELASIRLETIVDGGTKPSHLQRHTFFLAAVIAAFPEIRLRLRDLHDRLWFPGIVPIALS